MKILITGPQGSGKSTQADILSKKLGIAFINAGNLVREMSKEDSERGRSLKNDLEAGRLVDDNIIGDLVRTQISQPECKDGFVTDGYPRTINQIKIFDPEFDRVFYLEISDEEALRRLLKRGRADDTLAVINERLKWYHEQTKPLLEFYQSKGILEKINGEMSIEEVAQEIEERLQNV